MFENIDAAPLGNLLQIKQDKGSKIDKIKKKGMPPKKKKKKKEY